MASGRNLYSIAAIIHNGYYPPPQHTKKLLDVLKLLALVYIF